MCKYGMLKRKNSMKDELTYVDNPVESEFPGHWLPLSILKKIMEMRARTPAELTKKTIRELKLYVSLKYIKTSPRARDITVTAKIKPIDNVIRRPTKADVIMSLIPNKESFTTVTTNDFKTPVILSSPAATKNKFSTYVSQLTSESSKYITYFKTIENSPITRSDTTNISGKTIEETNTELTSPLLTKTESVINNEMIDAKTTSTIVLETAPELQNLNLTTLKTTPLLPTKITTESITSSSEKSTVEVKTVATERLTQTLTTELTTESTTKETTEELTKELNKSAELKNVLTTDVTTSTVAETGNPFY